MDSCLRVHVVACDSVSTFRGYEKDDPGVSKGLKTFKIISDISSIINALMHLPLTGNCTRKMHEINFEIN